MALRRGFSASTRTIAASSSSAAPISLSRTSLARPSASYWSYSAKPAISHLESISLGLYRIANQIHWLGKSKFASYAPGSAGLMFLFRSCNLLDPASGELRPGVDILVENDRFKEVSDRPIKSAGATVVEVGGRTVMPG